ncbi:MAG: uroporphyrinogen decarboxylase family protein [Promethearchaeota archaeon]
MGATDKCERVLAALEHEETDRPPSFLLGADFSFYKQFIEKVGFGHDEFREYAKDGLVMTPPVNHALALELGFDCDWMTFPSLFHFEPGLENHALLDTWGGMFSFDVQPDGTPHQWYVGPHLTSREKVEEWWDLGRPAGYPKLLFKPSLRQQRVLLKKYDGFLMLVGLAGPFECLIFGIGFAQFARYARRDPEFLHEILERNFEVQAEGLKRIVRFKPPVVMCGDDYGYNEGLQVNVKHWREFIKPILGRYVEIVHGAGAKFVIHTCGNVGELFPDFVELGIDGVESLQPTINDLPFLKHKFGDEIALLGTVDDSGLLVNGTPAQVRAEVGKMVEVLGKGGGYVPGPTNFLLDAKVENVVAMLEAIHGTDAGRAG